MGILWGLLVMWTLFWSFTMLIGADHGFVLFIIGWTPAGLVAWFYMNRASKRESAHQVMLKEAGVEVGAGCDHSEDGTGIAINKQAKTLTLQIKDKWKTYPFTAIREWETRNERAGQIVATGLAGGVAALGANERMAREAKQNTGLFVTVKDVDNPKWRIAMKDEQMQARWMEILRQELNES